MSNSSDQDTSKVSPQYTGTPVPEPRYGSITQGTTGQREQVRTALFRSRIHRLQRKTGLKRPPH